MCDRLTLVMLMTIGIICEYNPFHNGHIYHIKKIKEKYPNAILVLCLNGYFLERGEISLLSKEDKTCLALSYGVDIVIELPVLYGTQSADKFSECAITLLHSLKVERIIFGSESSNIKYLEDLAKKQLVQDFKISMNNGVNYPAALNVALSESQIIPPNDLLGISYIKAILKHNIPIHYETILRTNSYHDINDSSTTILSASNIRTKLKNSLDISPYLPSSSKDFLKIINESLFFSFFKYKILTDNHLDSYLDVSEGLDHKLKKEIKNVSSFEDLVQALKSKRYTYNRLRRMLIHILLGITKEDADAPITYIHLLGFSSKGKDFLNKQKKEFLLPFKVDYNSKIYMYEMRASQIYDMLCHSNTYVFEKKNQPITPTLLNESNQK